MNFTRIVKADLDSPLRELSNGGFGVVVTLTIFRQLMCRAFLLGVQSSSISKDVRGVGRNGMTQPSTLYGLLET